MTLQNRVDPWGNLNAVAARGAWLGNRGILHDDRKQVIAPWRHKTWIICELQFRGRKRKVFSAGRYSELFFLDEATALAAGHRPCAECRRSRYNGFKALWCAVNLEGATPAAVPISRIDGQLHVERAVRGGGKLTFRTAFKHVPEGAFIEIDGAAFLIWLGGLHRWSPHGYVRATQAPSPSDEVTVLTPASIARLYQHGFKPQVHDSACG